MAAAALAVVGCGQLVTLRGPARPRTGTELQDLAIIEDGALLTRAGRIEVVSSRSEVERLIGPDDMVVHAQGRVVLPGFVDAHTHPVFAGTRVDEFAQRAAGTTYEQIAAAGGGIRSTVRKTRAASAEDLFHALASRAQLFLRNGTTTIEAKSGYGLSLSSELKMLSAISRLEREGPLRCAPTFLGAHEVPDEFRGQGPAYVDLLIHEMIPAVAAQQAAEYCDVFCEPGIFDLESSRRILQAAKDAHLGLRIHADQLSRSGAAQLAAEMQAATADHLEQIDTAGICALAAARVQPVLLPASVYYLGSRRFPPAREMVERGLAIVLATDFNPGSSPTPSIPFVLSLASTQMHLSPAEAITAVTINAACSLGRGDSLGSLEAGKHADFVIHNYSDYREIAYYTGVESAAQVYIAGEQVYARHG